MNEIIQQQGTGFNLASWLEEWMDTYKSGTVKQQTADMYRGIIKLILSTPYANEPLQQITERDLQRLMNQLQEMRWKSSLHRPYSRSIMRKVRLTLNQAFTVAKRQKLIEVNPCNDIKIPEAPTKDVLPLTHDEEARIRMACQNDKMGHLFLFLLDTGLRMEEMCQLCWDDYNKTQSVIKIRKSKTKAGVRSVWLLSSAQQIIEAQPRINRYIFNSVRKRPLSESTVRHAYERVRNMADVPLFTTHVCRHTFVTRLCEKGVPVKAIAQIIGHAKTNYVMDIYAMIEKEQLQREIYKLENNSELVTNGDTKGNTIKLPTVLYNIATSCATAAGITVNTFVAKIMLDSLKLAAETAISTK